MVFHVIINILQLIGLMALGFSSGFIFEKLGLKLSLTFRVIIAIYFFIEENKYFGWNLTPKSTEEVICDGIFLLLLSLCFFDVRKKNRLREINVFINGVKINRTPVKEED